MMEATNDRGFSLSLFSTSQPLIEDCARAGLDEVIVDWEQQGKARRQAGADTDISHDTEEDLLHVRGWTSRPVICRINQWAHRGATELSRAIELGADEVLLPMVRGLAEVEAALNVAGGRCGIGILVETEAAVHAASDLASLDLCRVYVGLNDMAIERRSPAIFQAVVDGTVERLRDTFRVRFGFGGLTLPDRGSPIPSRLLMCEMERIGADFSFLRRSFKRDAQETGPQEAIHRIRRGLAEARGRSQAQRETDSRELVATVNEYVPKRPAC